MTRKAADKGTPSDALLLYNRYFEYERVVSNVSVTDEGIFQSGQVPDTYGGAQLDLQCVHAVFMVNSKAEMILMEFEVESPMDSSRKRGGPIERDGVQIRAASGTSTVPLIQTTIPNSALDATRKQLGAAAKAQFQADLAAQPSQPKS